MKFISNLFAPKTKVTKHAEPAIEAFLAPERSEFSANRMLDIEVNRSAQESTNQFVFASRKAY